MQERITGDDADILRFLLENPQLAESLLTQQAISESRQMHQEQQRREQAAAARKIQELSGQAKIDPQVRLSLGEYLEQAETLIGQQEFDNAIQMANFIVGANGSGTGKSEADFGILGEENFTHIAMVPGSVEFLQLSKLFTCKAIAEQRSGQHDQVIATVARYLDQVAFYEVAAVTSPDSSLFRALLKLGTLKAAAEQNLGQHAETVATVDHILSLINCEKFAGIADKLTPQMAESLATLNALKADALIDQALSLPNDGNNPVTNLACQAMDTHAKTARLWTRANMSYVGDFNLARALYTHGITCEQNPKIGPMLYVTNFYKAALTRIDRAARTASRLQDEGEMIVKLSNLKADVESVLANPPVAVEDLAVAVLAAPAAGFTPAADAQPAAAPAAAAASSASSQPAKKGSYKP